MESSPKYIPVLRSKDREIAVLKSFNFGELIYPYIEIIKESVKSRKSTNKEGKLVPPKKPNIGDFQIEYNNLLSRINSPKVFVDIPAHIKPRGKTNPDIKEFLTRVARDPETTTSYLVRLARLDNKVIPVISTYYQYGIINSIEKLYNALKDHFPVVAIRTFVSSFNQDITQIKRVIQDQDYIFMDWNEYNPNCGEPDFLDYVNILKETRGTLVHLHSAIPKKISNAKLVHCKLIDSINNDHIVNFDKLGAKLFADYAGIKKAELSDGSIISPGCIFYDAVLNKYFGYRFQNGNFTSVEHWPKLIEFENTIVPAIINSDSTRRMMNSDPKYLNDHNPGWRVICEISQGITSGQNQAKFKEITINHYLHCMKTNILKAS